MKKVLAMILACVLLLGAFPSAANAAAKPVPGYYLVGMMNGWSLNAAYRMKETDDGSLALSHIGLAPEDEFKIVYSSDGISKDRWYPAGVDNNLTVSNGAGYYTLRMAAAGLGVPEEWGGFYFTAELCEPSGGDPIAPLPTETETGSRTRALWESGALPTAEDIEEAANEQLRSRTYFYADQITVANAYRFNCAPAFVVDYEAEGYGIYLMVILNERLGDYLLYSSSSYEPSIFFDDRLLTFTKAYEAGVLTDEMLAELAAADYKGSDRYGKCRILTRYINGDADGDGDVNIVDATYIQRYTVRIIDDTRIYRPLTDVDGDNDVNIIDATRIMRYVVGISGL